MSYIGVTTTSVSKRLTIHAHEGSIQKHMTQSHNRTCTRQDLVDNTKILEHLNNPKTKIHILEKVYISQHTPLMNIPTNTLGPSPSMSYIPPWNAGGGSGNGNGNYPHPHFSPSNPQPQTSSNPPSSPSPSSQQGSPAASYHNLSPPEKRQQPVAPVMVTQSEITPKSSSATTSSMSSSSSSSLSTSSYQPQGYPDRSEASTPPKHLDLGVKLKNDSMDVMSDLAILQRYGQTAADLKSPRKAPLKGPVPEQFPAPVMFSYQGRGRPRKNWSASHIPAYTPVTHPPREVEEPEDEGEKPFKCNLCGKGFKVKGGLQQHERTHSTDKPYVCQECGKLFRQPTHLQQHLRIHTGEKPYDCPFCDKSFRQRTILNQHLRIHTGEKPYRCMECGKQFRQKAILDQHYRTHLGEKPYACPHPACRKHFREMASLISHMKCHKDAPDPKLILQQARQMIKEEQNEEIIIDDDRGPTRSESHERNHVALNFQKSNTQSSSNHQSSQQAFSSHNSTPEIIVEKRSNSQPQSSQAPVGSSHPSVSSANSQPQSTVSHQNSSVPPSHHPMPMSNLIPYPHSIFPGTSYMVNPDPRQYHPPLSTPQQLPSQPGH